VQSPQPIRARDISRIGSRSVTNGDRIALDAREEFIRELEVDNPTHERIGSWHPEAKPRKPK